MAVYSNDLPIIVRGIDHKLQRHIIRPSGHKLYQITLVTSGCGIYKNENKVSKILKRGTVFMFRSFVPHEYYGTTDDFKTYWINIDGSAVEGLFNYINAGTSCVFDTDNEYEYNRLELIFNDIYKAYWESRLDENLKINNNIAQKLNYNQYKESEMKASASAYSLIENISAVFNRKKYVASKNTNSEIVPVLEMIQTKYMDNIGVSDMADLVGISVNKLAALFKKNYGITPSRYLMNTRLNFAEMFLRKKTDKTVKEISQMVGFNNSGYFIRVFKSRFGVTPEIYREMYYNL